jgi:hypothetical protein
MNSDLTYFLATRATAKPLHALAPLSILSVGSRLLGAWHAVVPCLLFLFYGTPHVDLKGFAATIACKHACTYAVTV